MATEPAQIVIWIVDDDIDKSNIIGPFEDCLNAFINDMSGGGDSVPETIYHPNIDTITSDELAKVVRWKKTYKLPSGFACFGNQNGRSIDVLVYGIKKWDPLFSYFNGKYDGMVNKSFWPHLVFTDIHDGVRKILTSRDDVKKLPGYLLAIECNTRKIPCIVITSERTTIDNFELWYGLKNVFPTRRENIGPVGYVFETLKFRLSERLRRTIWIPEFDLTLEGYQKRDEKKYRVIFKLDGEVLSEREVTPFSYGFLYIWAHGSKLARLNNWHEELFNWESSICPAVSIPPSNKEGGKEAQVNGVMDDLFTPKVWKQKRNKILYHGGKRNRPYNILSANITYLDVPCSPSFPACWSNNSTIKEKIRSSLRHTLPLESLAWFDKCCPAATAKTT